MLPYTLIVQTLLLLLLFSIRKSLDVDNQFVSNKNIKSITNKITSHNKKQIDVYNLVLKL